MHFRAYVGCPVCMVISRAAASIVILIIIVCRLLLFIVGRVIYREWWVYLCININIKEVRENVIGLRHP